MSGDPRPKCSSLLTRRWSLAKMVCALAIAVGLAAVQAASQTPTMLFSGSAYGTYAHAGGILILGQTAPVGTSGCGVEQIGYHVTGTVASVSHEPEADTGIIDTSVTTFSNGTTATSDVRDVNLLSGVITATEVKAVSTVSHGAYGLQASGSGSYFSNLVVGGKLVNRTTAPNTMLALAGLGHVVLNEQISSGSASQLVLTVNMIHVYITATTTKLPLGTEIIVGSARSGLTVVPGPSIVGGGAYGTLVRGQSLQSSYTAPVTVPCQGSNGTVYTNTSASVYAPPVLTTGTVTDTAEGNVTPSLASASTQSTVHAVNILKGLVTADSVDAAAHGSTTDGVNFEFNEEGFSITNLKVAGAAQVTVQVAPNTAINLLGVGTLWLNRVVTTSNSIEVRAIELVVQQPNVYNLSVGTDIRVGDAWVQLYSVSKPSTH